MVLISYSTISSLRPDADPPLLGRSTAFPAPLRPTGRPVTYGSLFLSPAHPHLCHIFPPSSQCSPHDSWTSTAIICSCPTALGDARPPPVRTTFPCPAFQAFPLGLTGDGQNFSPGEMTSLSLLYTVQGPSTGYITEPQHPMVWPDRLAACPAFLCGR